MDRGRSRDVSPIALGRKSYQQALRARISFTLVPPSNLPKHHFQAVASTSCHSPLGSSATMPTSACTRASSSRLSVSPPLASHHPLPNSSSTIDSMSPEPTPLGPLTPPEYADPPRLSALAIPLDYYDSPPSPPSSLQDQMQVAYAFENMHLAKVLLLKLQGIEVNGDDDPRIAAVTDEDFHSSFVPSGSLPLDEADERRCREGERRERERRRRREREERLRACERLWEGSTQRVREERMKAARQREAEARQRRRAEIEARERAKEKEAREREQEMLRQTRVLRIGNPNQRPLLCYGGLADTRAPKPQSPPRPADDELFQFALMPMIPRSASSSSCSISPPDKDSLSLPRMRREFALRHAQSLSHTVPFSDVIMSMHGPLFPEDPRPEVQLRRSPVQMDLLESLFKVVEWEEQERVQVKGKAREDSRPQRSSTTRSESDSASIATSTSATTITRSNSWFSFGSRGSVSTTLTTPSTSPFSPKKVPVQLPPLTPFPIYNEPLPIPIRHSCRHPPRSSVPTSEHPLSLPIPPPRPPKLSDIPLEARGRPLMRGAHVSSSGEADADTGLVRRVSRSVSSLMDLAAQLQRAYVRATMLSMGEDVRSPSPSHSRSSSPPCGKLRPEGYRAAPVHVQLFPTPTRTLIPLGVPGTPPPRVFALPAPPPRSPFRIPGAARCPRLRPIANPVLLRLQALQNVCAGRALVWEGRARDGLMCAGKEKMLGVAWEGIGRSGLGWEVSAFC
ncbi:hypothetical protein B0H21DRAFT_838733 [Amylocystis lapponica]|nr:hypothetical protein B0H21DRAFT_838733 [Amylocystis lapponica]